MKVRCRREKFVPLFNLIASFTSTRDVRPALQNVKMVADDNKLVLTATDGNLGAQGELSVDDGFVVESSGEAILPAKLLRKILTETTDEEITLELDGKIDAESAPQFEKEIDSVIDKADSLVLDMSDLEYISSAGLRALLVCKKQCPALEIENMRPEVFNVFHMTGFDNIIPITLNRNYNV